MMRLLVACAVALAACDHGFEPQYLVTDLRILAVRAEAQGSTAADLTPGDTLVLRALVANPRGRPGATVTWYGCPPPANESLTPCADIGFLASAARLATDPRVVRLGTCEPDAGGVCTIAAPLPDVAAGLAFVAELAAREPGSCRLYAELPVVAVARAEGRQDVALKRVRVVPPPELLAATGLATSYVTNLNPDVRTVVRAPPARGSCSGGTELVPGPFPRGETTLCAVPASGWAQAYDACGSPGAERADWQWFATAGEFPEFDGVTGNVDRNEPRFVRPAGPFTIWTILRDGRGGEGWLVREVGPAP